MLKLSLNCYYTTAAVAAENKEEKSTLEMNKTQTERQRRRKKL
jgi:hypothetical protein